MLFVDEILYRRISPADFKNIESVKIPDNGGGQTYIDLSGIDPELIVEFCKYGTQTPGNKFDGVEWPTFKIPVIPAGGQSPRSMTIDMRRKGNYRICKQTLRTDRHPAWDSSAGFPTIVGTGQALSSGKNYPDSVLDPLVSPIVNKLSIYIVRTINHLYFADYIFDDQLPKNWPQGVGLQTLLSSNWDNITKRDGRGIFRPTELLRYINQRG